MPRYNPQVIEPKWQRYWEEHQTFRTPRLPEGQKYYVLDMFPYPSGEGLHVGHPEGYTATDIMARYKRMRGWCVMHPMGFDAFGLPAEEHAITKGVPPQESTYRNIANFRRQLKMLGFSYDWSRELATTDPDYYRWTQWIFLVLFDTWFDPQQQKGRPIAELPIPEEVQAQGPEAVEQYRDEHRLAYQAEALVNWCPALGTVLANEEVKDGRSERGGHPVQRIPLRQWMLRITAYADRLERELDLVDWPEGIKALQRNWIGRSEGAEVDFFIGSQEEFQQWRQRRQQTGFPRKPEPNVLRVYTTRPDTLFGATYMVIAPEHPLLDQLTTPEQREQVEQYRRQAATKSDLDRTDLAKQKTGVFTGSYAINPVNGREIPIWVADYVLMSYGTGAIMAVPAHDERDFEFAQQYHLPVVAVVDPKQAEGVDREAVLAGRVAFTGPGRAINSGPYNGLTTEEFKRRITEDLARQGLGRFAVNYRLRDWLFSRQRFWGEPFPILHELDDQGRPTGRVVPVPEEELPVLLPQIDDYKPIGRPEPPLEKAPPEWLYVQRDGKRYKRETNTMPQWAGSCWYYLRFLDPKNQQRFVDPEVERAWMPVDLYVGGAEHAVLHLLYARFWHKVLYDRGYVSTPEPFMKLVNQGMILGEVEITGYQDAEGRWVSADLVASDDEDRPVHKQTGQELRAVKIDPQQAEKRQNRFVLKEHPEIRLESRAYKMSKSRGNVVNPDHVVQQFGADALRLYEMFMGPLEATKPWSMDGVSGVRNFLDRVWRLVIDQHAPQMQLHPAVADVEPNEEQLRVLHRTIKAVTEDIEKMSFNTAIARMMEFVNFFTHQDPRPKRALEQFVLLLSPFAPHLAEELWQALGHEQSLAYEPWPEWEEKYVKQETLELPVQVNGKVRGRITVPADADQEQIKQAALSDEKVAAYVQGKQVARVIVVPGRLVNVVVR